MFLPALPNEFLHRRKSFDARFCETICNYCGKTVASSPCSDFEVYLLAAEVAHVCPARIEARGVRLAA